MSPKYKPTPLQRSYAEYRSLRAFAGDDSDYTGLLTPENVWWTYITRPGGFSGPDNPATLSDAEHRVLSKASNPAGGYLVPSDFDVMITTARRARAVIGNLAREVVTAEGTSMQFGSATTHGVATWTAENAAGAASSDETFGQTTLSALGGTRNHSLLQDRRPPPLPRKRTRRLAGGACRARARRASAWVAARRVHPGSGAAGCVVA